jgi:hypothetical protein
MARPSRRDERSEEIREELYGAPLSRFTAERRRLAAERRAAGEASAAAAIGKLRRPGLAAWVVNQLWRVARAELEALFAAGQRMRQGEAAAGEERRAILARLRGRAEGILRGDGHATSAATMRRVMATLESLSATGGFAPDPPGQLVAERDPPGFEVLLGGGAAAATPPARPVATAKGAVAAAKPAAKPAMPSAAEKAARARAKAEARARAREEAARRVEVARRAKERVRLEKERDALAREIERAAAALEKQRAQLEEVEERLRDRE